MFTLFFVTVTLQAERLALKFKKLLYRYGESESIPVKDMISKLMRDTKKAEDESRLPHICSLDWELGLSSIFVKEETDLVSFVFVLSYSIFTKTYNLMHDGDDQGYYGTRSTAAITVSGNGQVSFYETYLEKEVWKEQIVRYCIENQKP